MADFSPLVSVVIPAYGVTDYIAETLSSVLAQTYQNFEVIVVNDCCPDSERLNTVIARFLPRITYIQLEKNSGVSSAKNRAIRTSRGEFIAFLDGDDLWDPNYLEAQLSELQRHPDACLVYGNSRIVGSVYDGELCQTHAPSIGDVTIANLLQETVNVASMNVSRKQVLMEAGLFDESFRRCEDFDLWLRVVLCGGKIIYHSQVIASYRRRADSLTTHSRKMFEAKMGVLKKLESDPRLTDSDRVHLENLEKRWTAEADLVFGKQAFEEGKLEEAVRYMAAANAYFKKPKLTLVHFMMKYFPAILRLSMKIRRKTGGF